jgi:hypothetical protein
MVQINDAFSYDNDEDAKTKKNIGNPNKAIRKFFFIFYAPGYSRRPL